MPRLNILGVGVDCVQMPGALEAIRAWLSQEGPPRAVATVNPEFVMRARGDPDFARALAASDLCLPDGAGVVWALRRRGCELSGRVTGVDLVPELARLCAELGAPLYLLGAAGGVAEAAANELCRLAPGLRIAGTFAGSPGPEEEARIVDMVNASRARALLVAYGHPAQELWIARNRERLNVRVAIGVGGALDFLSGSVRRAPSAWQARNLEWLYRLITQPWRWRRMLNLPRFALLVLAGR